MIARPVAMRTYATASPSDAVSSEKQEKVLQKGAKRDPELYVCTPKMMRLGTLLWRNGD